MNDNTAFIRLVFMDGTFIDSRFILKNIAEDFSADDLLSDSEEDKMYDSFYALEDDHSGKYKYAFLVYGESDVSFAIVFGKEENILIDISEMVTVREKYMSDFLVGPYCGNMIAINSVDISSGLCMVAINTDNGRKNMAMQISQLEPFGDGFEFPIYSSNLLDSFLGE